MSIERCINCDSPTGKAGDGEDSIFAGGVGPLCEDCYEGVKQAVTAANRRDVPECPKAEWRGHLAYVNDELIGDVSRRGSIWRPSLCSRRYEPTRTEDESKQVVEAAWRELWAKIHGGKA